ncbi:MAG: hypothetical protein KIT72_01005 [Polyangiaceae bacterium]|nr:hypothetical protein [Polyangiaceae bacterium]MCW5788974.1 hypothetical protein [Polyangiaceae bacterium]
MRAVARDVFDLLTFRISAERMERFGNRHLLLGLGATWLVGIGRWWDDPNAVPMQKAGIGSVAYVFLLALVLFAVGWPLRPKRWSYRHVLTFITLTAPPAALYAIPVERMVSMSTATQMNLWFLLLVATWRVALLCFYLSRYADFSWWKTMTATLLPLAAIVVSLTILDIARGVLQFMGGLRDDNASQLASNVVHWLGFMSILAIIPLSLIYVGAVVAAWVRPKQSAAAGSHETTGAGSEPEPGVGEAPSADAESAAPGAEDGR